MANHCVFILLFFHLLFLFFDHFYGENEKRIVGKFICTCVCVVFFLTKRVTLTAKILLTTGRKNVACCMCPINFRLLYMYFCVHLDLNFYVFSHFLLFLFLYFDYF